MRPILHPSLVNGRFGDPALFVEMLHRRGALLFDMGDLWPLGARDLLRVTHIFVSHTHIDHFIGFDALLRVMVGRERCIFMVGPTGFREKVYHKLQGYEWDLVDGYETDLVFEVAELVAPTELRIARFSFRNRFSFEDSGHRPAPDGLVAQGPGFEVSATILDHHGPCLGFAVAERAHVNVWKNRLDERGLPTGQWLQALKQAVVEQAPDAHLIQGPGEETMPLSDLRELVTISKGQKIAYVTDVADTPSNRKAMLALAEDADTFFIESRFAAEDRDQAQDRAHLTTAAAGEIARAANVRKVEPFHFSARYEGEEERMLAEVERAFRCR